MALSTSSTVDLEIIREHNKHVINPPKFTSYAIKKYFSTRFSSLFVPKSELAEYTWLDILNPFKTLSELSLKNWGYFLLAFWIWTFDALDYFAVSLNLHAISNSLDVSVKDMSWSITLVLMLRSVGAVIFGLWGDKYGRRWPLIVNLAILCVLQIGTGFVKDFKSFLGVRALFGCFMGGIFGNAAAVALDDCPPRARGIISGMFQQGYAFGYLLAVIFTRAIVYNSSHTWRAIFWFTAGPPVILVGLLLYVNETEVTQFNLQQRKLVAEASGSAGSGFKEFGREAKRALDRYWLIIIYCVLMMAGFNFMSHGSQDLYPTMLTVQLGYNSNQSTVTNSVANLGAIFGGTLCGHLSTFVGRRLTVIIACVIGGAMIYPWAFVRNGGINAGVFFLQACVQGGWGVVPIHLSELSPPTFRSFVAGVSYQLGNLASSASSTIESTIGERFPIGDEPGVYDYAKVMSIFMGCVFAYLMIILFLGPENRGATMDSERDHVLSDVGDLDSMDDKPQVLHKEEKV